MISFWEKNSFTQYDIIIVGSGITGLSCAASLKEENPNLDILVIERGIFPSGASTKNAGFACFGSLTELVSDLDTMSESEMIDLVTLRWNGLSKLRNRLTDEKIGFLNQGGYELIGDKEFDKLSRLEEVNNLLKDQFDAPVFQLCEKRIGQFGFNRSHVRELVLNPFESQIDTGMMMKSLIQYCHEIGITILNGVTIESIEESETKITFSAGDLSFSAQYGVIATNAFTSKFYPEFDIAPGRGIVLVTKPISDLSIKGTFHMDEGYYYFRDYHNRLIFGGGRNLFFNEETTTEFSINEKILDKLKDILTETILPNSNYEIEQTWAGIMAFGDTKQPIIEKKTDRLFMGVRMGGMGVAIGSMVGEKLANLMNEELH